MTNTPDNDPPAAPNPLAVSLRPWPPTDEMMANARSALAALVSSLPPEMTDDDEICLLNAVLIATVGEIQRVAARVQSEDSA